MMHRYRMSRHGSDGFGGGLGRMLHKRMGGRHGLGRIFDQGDLRWVILGMIAEKPRHGYELIRAIEEKVGGAYSPSPGVIYPTLTLLEELGHIAPAEASGAKKAYAITEAGRAALAENAPLVDDLQRRLQGLSERFGGGPPAPVLRAMENLRLALRLRLERGRPDEADVARIVAAIDAAAREVER